MLEEASDALHHAIDLNPESAVARRELGLVYDLMGDRQLAEAYLQAGADLESAGGTGEAARDM